ncbi:MAG: hypothetical protein A07HB70_01770 [uncultured archaeon A07HB70]|nr:MAG: hypothetical protein A07HB70_01770 [uncultured archaeon A07HB70]
MASVRFNAAVRSELNGRAGTDVRTVSGWWSRHDAHESADGFVYSVPLTYSRCGTHDRYAGSTSYGIQTLFRVFLLKECHGWDDETALVEYLGQRPGLCDRLGLESVPDQSTLWRSWHQRLPTGLRDTVEAAARSILIRAQNAEVPVPREPEQNPLPRGEDPGGSDPDNRSILDKAGSISEHVSRLVFPAFSLNRGDHENAYWGLRPVRDSVRTWTLMGALGALSTSQLGTEHHLGTLIANTFATSLSSGFERCTDRRSGSSSTRSQRRRSSSEPESSPPTSPKQIPSRAIERATRTRSSGRKRRPTNTHLSGPLSN